MKTHPEDRGVVSTLVVTGVTNGLASLSGAPTTALDEVCDSSHVVVSVLEREVAGSNEREESLVREKQVSMGHNKKKTTGEWCRRESRS